MRLQSVRPPDFLDAADRDAHRLRHGTGAPVCRVGRVFCRCLGHNLQDYRRRQGLLARRASLVPQQAINARLGKAGLPAPDRRLRLAGAPHDLHGAHAIDRQQHDLGAPGVLLRGIPVRNQFVQPNPILGRKLNRNAGSHATRIA